MEGPWESRRQPSGMALRVRGGFFEEGPAKPSLGLAGWGKSVFLSGISLLG